LHALNPPAIPQTIGAAFFYRTRNARPFRAKRAASRDVFGNLAKIDTLVSFLRFRTRALAKCALLYVRAMLRDTYARESRNAIDGDGSFK
jgi:hypothetical protein